MLKSKRKLVITLSVVGVIILLLILSSALFSLKTVTVDFATINSDSANSVLINYDKDEIVKVGNFAYNKNILFISYSGAKDRIEKAFPFAKVQGFTRHFPSSVVVTLTEREPVIKVARTDGKWAILDDELKVLMISNSLSEYYANLPTLDSTALNVNGVEEGSFVSSNYLSEALHNIKRGITDNDVNLNMKTISSISIEPGESSLNYHINIVLNDGCKIVLKGLNNLAEKSLGTFKRYKTDVRTNTTTYPDITKVTISVEADYTLKNGIISVKIAS